MSPKRKSKRLKTKRIIRQPVVSDKTGQPRSSIYRLVSEGEFPRPIKLTERSVGWIEDEVDEWIEQKIAQSRQDVTEHQSDQEGCAESLNEGVIDD